VTPRPIRRLDAAASSASRCNSTGLGSVGLGHSHAADQHAIPLLVTYTNRFRNNTAGTAPAAPKPGGVEGVMSESSERPEIALDKTSLWASRQRRSVRRGRLHRRLGNPVQSLFGSFVGPLTVVSHSLCTTELLAADRMIQSVAEVLLASVAGRWPLTPLMCGLGRVCRCR
jgi:hypothetical protein